MGFIEKRAARRWKARYRAPDGKERSRTFDRRVDAERWLATQQADVARGAWVDPALGRMTFEMYAARWEKGLVGLRPTTRALNVGVVRKYLVPRFGDWPLAGIATSDVNAMVREEMDEGLLSPSALRRHVLVLGSVLGAAVKDGRIARNPCRGVELPPDRAREMRFLEASEVVKVADRIGEHFRPMVLTAGFVGLRYGELAGLAVEKVNLLKRTIRVERQLLEVGGKLIFGPPKTRAGVRTVSIPAGLAGVLEEHFATPPVVSSGLAFPSPRGKRLRRSNFRKVWRKACTRAGFDGGRLDGLVFHELRHSSVALAVQQGAHPLAIKERHGHSSIAVTMDVYGGLFPSLEQAIAEGLDEALSEALAASSRPETASVVQMGRSEQ